jgi:3-hydroxyisobutyrate dehydrogenase-like beta-hydroxyacid dehydrogenase
MNLNIAGQMQALSESLTCARQAGIDDDFFFQVLAKNVSYSGLARLKEGMLKARDFTPQFSIKHMHKDMRLAEAAIEMGTLGGCPNPPAMVRAEQSSAAPHASKTRLPLLATVRECLARAEREGMADDDFSSLIRLLSI